MRQGRSVFAAVRGMPIRLPRIVERLLLAGTGDYPTGERRGLIIANATGYLACVSSLVYAATYALHDARTLWPLVAGNLLSAVCTAMTPLFHRFGPAAAALWLGGVIFTTIFYFIAYIGRDSGIQLNYIGAAAVALAILGVERIKTAAFLAVVAAACHLTAWYLFPPENAIVAEDPVFLDRIYGNSAISIMAIVFLVVFYGLRLARTAEARTDALLHNMMPAPIVTRLKEDPGSTIADAYEEATVLFADLKGFTSLSAALGPVRIVRLLDELFSAIDREAAALGLEKIKTIGDAYMAVAGVPEPRPDHAEAAVRLALAMQEAARAVGARHGLDLSMRAGIASGPVMAGVIGQAKFSYDVWGDTVNLAARLETYGEPGRIHVSASCRAALGPAFRFTEPARVDLKGIGAVEASFLAPVEEERSGHSSPTNVDEGDRA